MYFREVRPKGIAETHDKTYSFETPKSIKFGRDLKAFYESPYTYI